MRRLSVRSVGLDLIFYFSLSRVTWMGPLLLLLLPFPCLHPVARLNSFFQKDNNWLTYWLILSLIYSSNITRPHYAQGQVCALWRKRLHFEERRGGQVRGRQERPWRAAHKARFAGRAPVSGRRGVRNMQTRINNPQSPVRQELFSQTLVSNATMSYIYHIDILPAFLTLSLSLNCLTSFYWHIFSF